MSLLGPDLPSFTSNQIDIIARRRVLNPPPSSSSYRPNLNLHHDDIITHDGTIDMMACCQGAGRKIEEMLEKKNSCRFMIVFSIAFAICSAILALLQKQSVAVSLAVVMVVFLILASWAYIFGVKRQQIDYILENTRTGTRDVFLSC